MPSAKIIVPDRNHRILDVDAMSKAELAAIIEDLSEKTERQHYDLRKLFSLVAAIVRHPDAITVHTEGHSSLAYDVMAHVEHGTNIDVSTREDKSRIDIRIVPPSVPQALQYGILGKPIQLIHRKVDGTEEVH